MSNLWNWCTDKIHKLWGILWIIILTGISVGGVIWVCQWIMRMVGAM